MKINKSRLTKIVVAGFLVLLFVFLIIDLITTKVNHKVEMISMIDRLTYVKNATTDDMFLQKNQEYMKYLGLYLRYLELFSQPNKKLRMNRFQIQEYARLSIEYVFNFRLPKFFPIVIPIIESNLNPHAVGPSGELSINQQHRFAMGTVYLALKLLRGTGKVGRKWADELDPKIVSHADLKSNPIASLKCLFLIAWYNKREFEDNVTWWVSGVHWGYDKLTPYFNRDIKMSVKITPKLVTKDKRFIKCKPRYMLQYFQHFIKIHDKLSTGRIDIYDYVKAERKKAKAYIDGCSKAEADYIKSVTYVNILMKRVAHQELMQKKLNIQLNRYINYHVKTKDFIFNVEKERKNIYKKYIVKEQNFKKAYSFQDRLMKRIAIEGKKIYKKIMK